MNDPEDPQNGEGMRSSVPLTGSQKLQGGDPQYVTWLYASGIGPNLEDRSGLDEGDEEVLAYKGRNGQRAGPSPGTMKTVKNTAAGDGSATAATTIGRFPRNTGSISPTG